MHYVKSNFFYYVTYVPFRSFPKSVTLLFPLVKKSELAVTHLFIWLRREQPLDKGTAHSPLVLI